MSDLAEVLKLLKEISRRLDRLEKRVNPPIRMPYISAPPMPPVYPAVCKDGGPHEYPMPWHSTLPAPCNKYGYTLPHQHITFSSNSSDNESPV